MAWFDGLNAGIRYIEDHLTEDIRFEPLAKLACCSTFHYQRMFAYLAGIPLSEYIRRRRMSCAAVDLQAGGKVVDVALKYGYQSPTAFNRAFQAVHGMPPSAVQAGGGVVKSYPPLRFSITVTGAEELEYRIEKRPPFRIVGISAPLDKEIEKNFAAVPALWGRAASDGTVPRLASMMDGQPAGLLGVSACQDGEDWRYFIAVSSSLEAGPFEEYTVPAATWAVFPGEGTNRSLQELERRIVTEWFPASGYEYGSAPDVEVYLSPDPDNARYEVWVPVIKKIAPVS